MKVSILYFAQLREKTGLSKEVLEIDPCSVEDLYIAMDKKYDFQMETSLIKYAINENYVEKTTFLKDGDEVIFITPVAGG